MQQLHLVGLTTDHTGLILSARRGAKTGKYTVTADDKLLAALQEAQRLRDGGEENADGFEKPGEESADAASPPVALPSAPPPKPVSALSPREIQARLRAGGAVSEIAAAAGVDEEWILRFADPIRAEQARVVERAQALTFNKPRLGLSAEPLATSVLLNLAERGVRLPADVFDAAWTAFSLHGTNWAVLFSYTSRKRRQSAQWEVDLRSGELTARNRLASDLAYLEPGRRRRRMEPLELSGADEEAPATRRAPRRAAGTAAKKAAKPTPAAAKKAGAGNRATATRNGAAGTKAAATKAPASKKATVAKNAGASGAAAAASKVAAVKKGGARQSSPRGRRPAKKPAAKKPAAPPAGAPVPEAPALPERPTHLARPPSPMNPSNRPVTLSGRLAGAPSLRPPAPPPPPRARARAEEAPRPAPPRRPPEEARQSEPEPPPQPDTEEAPAPAPEAAAKPAPTTPEPSSSPPAPPEPRVRRRRSERRISPRAGEQPAVVILSTPAVRRLESDEEQERKPPPPS